MEPKTGYATVLGQRFAIEFSEYSDEYFECHTQRELNAAAKAEILAKLNELVEIADENAHAIIRHAN